MLDYRCLICDSNDWENVDELIHKKQGTHICKNCGFVTYDSIVDNEKILEMYRKEYRPAPTWQNECAADRKQQYHQEFLRDHLKQWAKEKKKMNVFDVGAAYGRLLYFIKSVLPESEVSGSELTLCMRRVAKREYNIDLSEDFDTSKKYGLICSYKSAEHIADVDKELIKYKEALTDDGLLYIGVPIWFKTMANFGSSGFDISNYYHPNHINLWTRKLFLTLLKKTGFEIVKTNTTYYDDVYLCKRNDSLMAEKPEYEKPEEIKQKMMQIKQASRLYDDGKFKEALTLWPDYPHAYLAHYESNRAQYDKEGLPAIKNLIEQMLNNCPDSYLPHIVGADLLGRYDQFEDAIKLYGLGLERCPNNVGMLMGLSHMFRGLKNYEEAHKICSHIFAIAPQQRSEARTWMLKDSSMLPIEGE